MVRTVSIFFKSKAAWLDSNCEGPESFCSTIDVSDCTGFSGADGAVLCENAE